MSPGPSGREPWTARVARGLIRLLGLALTLVLATGVATASLDLVMNQCAGSLTCRKGATWLDPVAFDSEGARFLIGVLPPSLVVVLLWWFGRQTFLHSRPDRDQDHRRFGDWADPLFWRERRRTDLLRHVHVAACCATLGLLFLGVLDRPLSSGAVAYAPAVSVVLFLVGAAILAFCTVVVAWPWRGLLARDRTWTIELRFRGRTRQIAVPVRDPIRHIKVLGAAYLVLVVGLCAWLTWLARPVVAAGAVAGKPLPHFDRAGTVANPAMAALVFALLLTCCVPRGIRYVARLRQRRRGEVAPVPHEPAAFRPMFGGYAAVVLASLSATLAAGFSSGLVFWTARLVETPRGDSATGAEAGWEITLGPSWWAGAVLWGVSTVVFLLLLPAVVALVLHTRWSVWLPLGVAGLAAVPAAAWAILSAAPVGNWALWSAVAAPVLGAVGGYRWFRLWRNDELAETATDDYPESSGTEYSEETDRKIAVRWRLARAKHRLHWVLGTVATLSMLSSLVFLLAPAAPAMNWVFSVPSGAFGTTVVTFLGGLFLTLGLRSWRNQKARTAVGVLWDLLSFWPRVAHPLCPPSYGGRTTLELVERVNHLVQRQGADAVVLSGHSQGSMVCFAALVVLERESQADDDTNDLLPCAEAAQTLSRTCLVTYGSQLQWAHARLFPAYVGHGQLERIYRNEMLGGRWRNVYRWTDPLGGPVLSWPAGRVTAPPQLAVDRFPLPDRPSVDPGLEPDVRLYDPAAVGRTPDRPRSPMRGHGGYYDDCAFDDVVNGLAASVPRPVAAAPVVPDQRSRPQRVRGWPAGGQRGRRRGRPGRCRRRLRGGRRIRRRRVPPGRGAAPGTRRHAAANGGRSSQAQAERSPAARQARAMRSASPR